jgi:hypothetical protein
MKARLAILLIAGFAIAAFFMMRKNEQTPEGAAVEAKEGESGEEAAKRRDGRTLIPEKLPGEKPEGEKAEPTKGRFSLEVAPQPALSGLEFQEATAEDRERQGVTDEYGKGVTVTRIHPDSSAAEVAMQVGDVIVRAQKENVNSAEDLRRIIGDRDHVVVNIMRQGQLLSVVLQKPFIPK